MEGLEVVQQMPDATVHRFQFALAPYNLREKKKPQR
jgi:hypothetical protein